MSLSISNIKFNYDDFSLKANIEVEDGEFVSILGPSGSGKTTLLRLIAGFQKPVSGSIILSGRNITELPTAARNIGMVFQDYALFPHMDVFNNIAYGLKTKKIDRERIQERVTQLLKLVNLAGYANRRTDELSGGEKQRVALARALAPEPKLLLFDEPLSALDVKLRKMLRREIKRIQRKLGFTAVYVTHDQDEAMSISDRIAVMNRGRICQFGSPEEIYNNPTDYFTADFIGTMNRLPSRDNIMFRPEACRLLSGEESNIEQYISLSVTVENAEYSGGYYICEAQTESGEPLTFYSPKAFHTGIKLFLRVNRSAILSRFE